MSEEKRCEISERLDKCSIGELEKQNTERIKKKEEKDRQIARMQVFIINTLTILERPVDHEQFKSVLTEEEWDSFCRATTNLIHSFMVVPDNGKIMLRKYY